MVVSKSTGVDSTAPFLPVSHPLIPNRNRWCPLAAHQTYISDGAVKVPSDQHYSCRVFCALQEYARVAARNRQNCGCLHEDLRGCRLHVIILSCHSELPGSVGRDRLGKSSIQIF